MPNLFKVITTLAIVIIAIVYLSNAFLEVDHANRQGCDSPYVDVNGTVQNCSLSNADLKQLNNSETSFGMSMVSVSMLFPLAGIAIIIISFYYISKVIKG